MKSCKLIIALVAVFAICTSTNMALAQHKHDGQKHAGQKHGEKDKKPIVAKCPVMGDPVDFSVKVDTKEGPVYFCCEACPKKFKEKPAKYAKKVAEQRKIVAALPKVQVTCPVSGKPVDKDVSIEEKGKKVFLCCKGCVGKYKKDPAAYSAKLAASYTYQTKCPVMGGDIDPTAFTTLPDGRKVYFCCPGCDKKFLKDPAKYAANLEAQGTIIDPEEIKSGKKKEKGGKHGEHGEHGDHGGHDH